MREFRFYGERPQWGASLVGKVEELIDIAIGEQGKNVVDFKMLQTILYILARHLRILEQMVEVRVHRGEQVDDKDNMSKQEIDIGEPEQKAKRKDRGTKSDIKVTSSSDSYLRSDESEQSGGGGRGKTGGRDSKTVKGHKAQKPRDKHEESIRSETNTKRERSKDWVTDDETEENDSSRRGKIKKFGQHINSKDRMARDAEDEESDGREKTGDKGGKSIQERKAKKATDQYEVSDRDHTHSRREKSKDRVTERSDMEERSERSRKDMEERSERSRDLKSGDKAGIVETSRNKSAEKDTKGKFLGKEEVGGDKKREKDKASLSGDSDSDKGKDTKTKERENVSYQKVGEKESVEKVKGAKGQDKKRGTKEKERNPATKYEENSEKERRRDKPGYRTSDDAEGGSKKEHPGKDKEGDKTGKKIKRSDSREETDGGGKKSKPGHRQVGSIEVVTQQQFRELARAVRELQARAVVPAPRMPDNKKLLADIAQGNASLPDVVEAMQLNARIVAAERAIDRMAQLISLLAASGELPAEVLTTFTELEADLANMAEKAQSMGAMKSPKEPGRKSLGLVQLGTVSTLSAAETEASAAMKRGIMGTLGRVTSEAKEKKGQIQGGDKVQQTQELEKGQQEQGVDEGQTLFVHEGDEDIFVKEKPWARTSQVSVSASTSTARSMHSKRSIGRTDCVTAHEMNEALRALREDFMKNVGNITARANASAEAAAGVAKDVASQLARAMTLNARVSKLFTMVNDYNAQLRGFDSGVDSQMKSFQQQLNNINRDLHEGLHELHNITNNAETAAVLELKEQYQVVAGELDHTLHSHKQLLTNQDYLTSEVKNIAVCIEELRDQKADCDEVIDGLRDKADLSRLAGLLTVEEFAKIFEELQLRIQMCYDKFRSQEAVWVSAVQEINEVVSAKAELSKVYDLRDEVQKQIQQLNRKAILLTRVLGEPKAAVITRRLTKGAVCAACAHAAIMEVSDESAPPHLPAFRPRPTGADDVCYRDEGPPLQKLPVFEDECQRPHFCKRWCGGSHTLLSSAVTRENAPPFTAGDTGPTRRYMALGTDNQLYKMADPCQPCEECNVVEKIPGETEQPSPHPGAGDQDDCQAGPTVVTGMEARRITIVADADIQLMRHELARKRRGVGRMRSSSSRIHRPDRGGVQDLDVQMHSHKAYEDEASRKFGDIGVIVKGRITVLDDEAARYTSGRCSSARRSSLAQDRLREQFADVMPNEKETDFITEAISALSEL